MRTFLAGGIIVIFIVIQLLRGGTVVETINGDGTGYYAYLTAVFIHHTTDFTPVYEYEKERRGLDYMAHYFHKTEHGMVNKYQLGTALMMLPFFLMAWLYSIIIGMPPDGYSILFQYAVSLAAAVYLAVGLLATRRLLQLFGIGKSVQLMTILALLFGTNLFYYAFLHTSHSHVYSFSAIAVFLLLSKYYFQKGHAKDFLLAAMALGLVVLIRPTNAIIALALPFLSGDAASFQVRWRQLISRPKLIAVAFLLFLSVFMLQPLFNTIQTGSWFLWSYQSEGFHFDNPALLSFLFSYRKGFFIYTPLMLLLVPALVLLYQRSRFFLFSFLGYFLVLIVLLSSWWNWFFGYSFGMRAMIDHYALLAIPLALMIQQFWAKRLQKKLMTVFLLLSIALNLIQTYQYHTGILHPDSMSKEKYWYVFLRTDPQYRDIFGSYPEPIYAALSESESTTYHNDMEVPSNIWTSNGILQSSNAYSGAYLAELNQSNIYSPTLVLSGEQLTTTAAEVYVTVSLMFKELTPHATSNALLVYAAKDTSDNTVFYKTFKMKQIPDSRTGDWRNAAFGFKVPAWNPALDQVKIYVWNRDAALFQLDDFEVNIYPLKP